MAPRRVAAVVAVVGLGLLAPAWAQDGELITASSDGSSGAVSTEKEIATNEIVKEDEVIKSDGSSEAEVDIKPIASAAAVTVVDDAGPPTDDGEDADGEGYHTVDALQKKQAEKFFWGRSFRDWTATITSMIMMATLYVAMMLFNYLRGMRPREDHYVFPGKFIELYQKTLSLSWNAKKTPTPMVLINRYGGKAAMAATAEKLGFAEAQYGEHTAIIGDRSGVLALVPGAGGDGAAATAASKLAGIPRSGGLPTDEAVEQALTEARTEAGSEDSSASAANAWFELRDDGRYDVKIAGLGNCKAMVIDGSALPLMPEDVAKSGPPQGSAAVISTERVDGPAFGKEAKGDEKASILVSGEEGVAAGSYILLADASLWKSVQVLKSDEAIATQVWWHAEKARTEEEKEKGSSADSDFIRQIATFFAGYGAHNNQSDGFVMLARLGDGSQWKSRPAEMTNYESWAEPQTLSETLPANKERVQAWLSQRGFDSKPPATGGPWEESTSI